VLVSYEDLPKKEEAPKRIFAFNDKKESPVQKEKEINKKPPEVKVEKEPKPKDKKVEKEPKEQPSAKEEKKPEKLTTPKPVAYKGDAPSVPCNVSIEINWASKDDNIDLFVCKGSSCVYGGRKKDKNIGQWDSGKSRNRLFGNDLRTTQEAVRQFDDIIPGEYKIYAQFKESKSTKKTVVINGLIYTKDDKNNERGEAFTKLLRIGEERTLVGTIVLQKNGLYHFKKN
jgi:type IV secretory pathway VirB10-like protein